VRLRHPTAETLEEKIWTEEFEKETFRVEAQILESLNAC
jgi:hypothetical protein